MNELTQEMNPGVTPPESAPAEMPSPMTIEMPAAPEISPTTPEVPEQPAPETAPPKFEPVPVTNIGPKVATLDVPPLTPTEMAEEVQAEKSSAPAKKGFLGRLFGRGT